MTVRTLRDRWRAGETTLGGWLAIPSPASAEAVARAGFDYVCVDTQHGGVEYSDSIAMIQAILLGGASPIVRVPWNEPGIIGKALDAGAHGVIIPMVNSVAEAEAAVSACRYAPDGSRSFGPGLVSPRVEGDYLDWARENVAVIPMIETEQAVGAVDEILGVGGIDAVYVGPSDLSVSLGLPPGNNDQEAPFADALATVVAACERAGVVAGIHCTGDLTPSRVEAGFRMVTVTTDLVAMRLGLTREVEAAHGTNGGAASTSLY